jgi:ectoine hydroxylase-related dioxygenase (phytanoyl-CoA dioxygenase family)
MNRHPPRPIGKVEREAYEREGIVCLRGMFDRDWIDFMGGWVDRAMAAPGPHGEEYVAGDGNGRFFGDLDIARRHEGFRRFIRESPAAEIAGRTMGAAQVNFFYDQLLVKEPGTAEHTPWHQDQPYWAVSGRQICSIWLPLDPIPEESCVEFVAGSHLWPE